MDDGDKSRLEIGFYVLYEKFNLKLNFGRLKVHCNVVYNVSKTFLGVHRFTSLPHHIQTLFEPKPNVAGTLLKP